MSESGFSDSYTDALDRDWPDCPRCGDGETAVTPATGEWNCRDCGCQWMPDEVPGDDNDAEAIPDDIVGMVDELFASLGGS